MCLLAYSDPVKQELGKEGILPFSKLWACDWPARAPTGEDYHLILPDKAKPVTQVEFCFIGSSAQPISSHQAQMKHTRSLPLSLPTLGIG